MANITNNTFDKHGTNQQAAIKHA
ncbi:hypothetical protein D039_2787A, partial [Vibrio parahaemolyticus EKP-028]